MHYEHIQQALDKVQATLSKEELEKLLQAQKPIRLFGDLRMIWSNTYEANHTTF